MIHLHLTQEQITTIDDIDVDLTEFSWYAAFQRTYGDNGAYMAQRGVRINGRQVTQLLHRVIMGRILNKKLERYEQVDHKDLNTLNNCRSNLRLATPLQNSHNRGKRKDNRSGYKGVGWRSDKQQFQSRIRVNGKLLHLGYFDDPIPAARIYDMAAIKHFGEFASVNFSTIDETLYDVLHSKSLEVSELDQYLRG